MCHNLKGEGHNIKYFTHPTTKPQGPKFQRIPTPELQSETDTYFITLQLENGKCIGCHYNVLFFLFFLSLNFYAFSFSLLMHIPSNYIKTGTSTLEKFFYSFYSSCWCWFSFWCFCPHKNNFHLFFTPIFLLFYSVTFLLFSFPSFFGYYFCFLWSLFRCWISEDAGFLGLLVVSFSQHGTWTL